MSPLYSLLFAQSNCDVSFHLDEQVYSRDIDTYCFDIKVHNYRGIMGVILPVKIDTNFISVQSISSTYYPNIQILNEDSDTITITWETNINEELIDLNNGEVVAQICFNLKRHPTQDIAIDFLDPTQYSGISIFDETLQFLDVCIEDGVLLSVCSSYPIDLDPTFELLASVCDTMGAHILGQLEISVVSLGLHLDYPITAILIRDGSPVDSHTIESIQTPPYNFSIEDGFDYKVIMENEQGCTIERDVMHDVSSAFYSISTFVNHTCNGRSEGAIIADMTYSITDTIGNPRVFEIKWSTGKSGTYTTITDRRNNNILRIDSLEAGDYWLSAKSDDCEFYYSYTIEDRPGFQVEPVTSIPSCGKSDGTISLNVSPVGDYEVTWNNDPAQTGLEVQNAQAGFYQYIITDITTGCRISDALILDENNIKLEILSIDPSTCTDAGKLFLELYDNTGEDLEITIGDNTYYGYDSVRIDSLMPGSYPLSVSNSTCSTDDIFIEIPNEMGDIIEIDESYVESVKVICKEEEFYFNPSLVFNNEEISIHYLGHSYEFMDSFVLEVGTHRLLASAPSFCDLTFEVSVSIDSIFSILPDTLSFEEFQIVDLSTYLNNDEYLEWLGSSVICLNETCSLIDLDFQRDSTFEYNILNENGCANFGSIHFDLIEEDTIDLIPPIQQSSYKFYSPNVINLNSNDNSTFCIYFSEDVVGVNYLKFFDRWGNQLVSTSGSAEQRFCISEEFHNENVVSGIYVMIAELELSNGMKNKFTESVLILN